MPSQTFTSSGTWTCPAGVTSARVECWGGGGGGGEGGTVKSGSGGGGGEYAAELANTVTAGTNYTVTVGAAGTAGTVGAGGNGGTTSFSGSGATTVTANGGHGGGVNGAAGGAGGTGSTNSTHNNGGAGGTGPASSTGGGGGSSGGNSAAGNPGATGGAGGAGGAAPAGGGPGGAGGTLNITGSVPSSGPGGGGGAGGQGTAGPAGGAGFAGQVTITWASPTAPGFPLIPPMPFSPMSYQFAPPPPQPVFSFAGAGAVAPFGGLGNESPPAFTGSGARPPFAAAAAATYANPFPVTPLGLKVEVLINGTWVNITSLVYARQDIEITRGRPDEGQQVQPSVCRMTWNNRDGRFSPGNPSGAFYPYFTRNTQVRVSLNTWSAPYLTSYILDESGLAILDESGAGITDESAATTLANYTGYRFWGEISSISPKWDPSGTDVYAEIVASGPLRRFSQGNAKIGSALKRYYASLAGGDRAPYGYWPAEDAAHATAISSAISGVPAMGYTGTPTFASDSSFGGSDPIPSVNSSSWHGQTLAASNPPGTGSLTQTTPGTYTWRCPPGVTSVSVASGGIIGGGGGGGAAGTTMGGGGGGGGGSAGNTTIPVTAGTVYTYVVGAGGSPGTTAGTQGQAGTSSSFTGDGGVTVTANPGQGGIGGDVSTGGAAGAAASGGFAGGAGGAGSAATTGTFSNTLYGNSGGSGGGADGGQVSQAWTAPAGITGSVSVTAQAGGGGGAGGASGAAGLGGGGGGGGGLSSGTTTVSAGSSVTFYAGSGGAGGTNAHGGAGAASTVSDSSVTANGGTGGSGSGNPGSGGSGTSSAGSGGGSGGAPSGGQFGGGGGGGGGGSVTATGISGAGRQPGGGGGNGSGGGWGSTSSGNQSSSTPGGTGSNGGGGGGGGAYTNTAGKVGGGGGAGYITWQWTVTGQPAGGGGGSSGGSATHGNAGTSGGTGGTAVTGGGAGGAQGKAGAAPGGGGGGGYPPGTGGGTTTAPGAGGAGQVSFSWSGGAVSPVAANIVRFLLNVQSSGGTDGAVVARISGYGTVARMDVLYHTGGALELIGYNASSTVLFDSGTCALSLNGQPVMVDVELTTNNAGGANWTLAAIIPGAISPITTYTGPVTGVSVGYVSDVYISPNADMNYGSAGQVTVQTYADTLASAGIIVNGYATELAADRISRLCAEENLGFTLVGTNTDTPQMGPQQDDTFTNVLQSCEDTDRGQLFESRGSFGVSYRTRVSLQAQNPVLTLDYSLAHVVPPLNPVADDQFTRNDITVTRNNGSSATAVLTTGAMSTQLPPNGVGDYIYTLTVYPYADTQLANLAAWMLTVGTVADARFPVISVNLARTEVASLFTTIAGVDIGDYVQVINPPAFLTQVPIQQLAWGATERLNAYKWEIDWNAVPQSPYGEGNPPTW